MCMLFAATYPERTSGLVLYNPVAKGSGRADYPWAMTLDEWRRASSGGRALGDDGVVGARAGPTRGDDDESSAPSAAPGASPSSRRRSGGWRWRSTSGTSCRRSGCRRSSSGSLTSPRRQVCRRPHPGSRGPGTRPRLHLEVGEVLDEIERFVVGLDTEAEPRPSWRRCSSPTSSTRPRRPLSSATVRGRARVEAPRRSCGASSTRSAARDRHCGRRVLRDLRGPIRAIRCARAIRDGVRSLGLEIRAGLHTGECERVDGEDRRSRREHRCARRAEAGGRRGLVSSTVKDLVAGSGSSSRTAACTTSRACRGVVAWRGAWMARMLRGPPWSSCRFWGGAGGWSSIG